MEKDREIFKCSVCEIAWELPSTNVYSLSVYVLARNLAMLQIQCLLKQNTLQKF